MRQKKIRRLSSLNLGFRAKNKISTRKKPLHTVIVHITWTILRSLVVLCHLFCCFDPRFKKNIHCHPAFIIRDINSCRKGYSKGRLKSRESDHFYLQIAFKSVPSQNTSPFGSQGFMYDPMKCPERLRTQTP